MEGRGNGDLEMDGAFKLLVIFPHYGRNTGLEGEGERGEDSNLKKPIWT
jgi:hypothetical protein